MTFTGNLQSIDKAYDKLVPQAMTKQWAMTGESREIYRRWGGVQSDNNQVQLAIGIKPAE